jgi:glycosyltransferase involved in cell wall biosynthesis
MHITIVLGPFFPVPTVLGGAVEKVHLQLASAYRAAGHDVTILSRRYRNFPNHEIVDGVKHIRIPSFDRTPSLIANLVLDFLYALRASFSLPRSDITVTNSFWLPLLLRRRTAGKTYVHVARFPKRQMFLYLRADRLQAVSQTVAKAIAAQTPSLAERVVYIGNPVPEAYFSTEAVPERTQTVLFVGRIAREKGVHLLVEAFGSLMRAGAGQAAQNWKLRIIGPHEPGQGGDGDKYLDDLRGLAAPLGTACEFAGPIFEQGQLAAEYRAASIFAYPSVAETGESFGLAPLEAMTAGCAVVVSDLRCFDDFVEDGCSGMRFDHRAGDHVGRLAAILKKLMDDRGLRRTIAKNGRDVAENFRTSRITAKMLEDFEKVIASGTQTKRSSEGESRPPAARAMAPE